MSILERDEQVRKRRSGTSGPDGGQRGRLVDAASQLFYQQGVEKTALADIALAAGVPQGNVYYYFKTKDELVEAVIEVVAQDLQKQFALLSKHRSPKGRLKALVRSLTDQRELVARYGCQMGSLCSELDKRANGLDLAAARLFLSYLTGPNRSSRPWAARTHEISPLPCSRPIKGSRWSRMRSGIPTSWFERGVGSIAGSTLSPEGPTHHRSRIPIRRVTAMNQLSRLIFTLHGLPFKASLASGLAS